MKLVGFKGSKRYKDKPHNADSQAANARRLSKIEALLADAQRPWSYALAMAKHMYKKDKLEFCSGTELSGIIAALVKNAKKRVEAVMCSHCDGTGECPMCHGTGIDDVSECVCCFGDGVCPECGGTGEEEAL